MNGRSERVGGKRRGRGGVRNSRTEAPVLLCSFACSASGTLETLSFILRRQVSGGAAVQQASNGAAPHFSWHGVSGISSGKAEMPKTIGFQKVIHLSHLYLHPPNTHLILR